VDVAEAAPSGERKRGVERLISFSDGIVAIAATLLVLPLVDIAREADTKGVTGMLSDNTDAFFVFGLSFVVICRLWLSHHAIFADVRSTTPALIWLNNLWLLSIVFLPFPTQLLGGQGQRSSITYGLYIGTMLTTTASAAAMRWVIVDRDLGADLLPRGRRSMLPSLITPSAMAIALILALTVPAVGGWALLLLFPAGNLEGRLSRSERERSAPRPEESG